MLQNTKTIFILVGNIIYFGKMKRLLFFFFLFIQFLLAQDFKDKGIGLLFLNTTEVTNQATKEDSIIIYKTKLCDKRIAKYTYNPFSRKRLPNKINADKDILVSGFIEFEYERVGVMSL
jgi:hypothetical protein